MSISTGSGYGQRDLELEVRELKWILVYFQKQSCQRKKSNKETEDRYKVGHHKRVPKLKMPLAPAKRQLWELTPSLAFTAPRSLQLISPPDQLLYFPRLILYPAPSSVRKDVNCSPKLRIQSPRNNQVSGFWFPAFLCAPVFRTGNFSLVPVALLSSHSFSHMCGCLNICAEGPRS